MLSAQCSVKALHPTMFWSHYCKKATHKPSHRIVSDPQKLSSHSLQKSGKESVRLSPLKMFCMISHLWTGHTLVEWFPAPFMLGRVHCWLFDKISYKNMFIELGLWCTPSDMLNFTNTSSANQTVCLSVFLDRFLPGSDSLRQAKILTVRRRYFHWAFSSWHICCDRVLLARKLVLHSETKAFRWHKPEGTVHMSIQRSAGTDRTHSINCTLSDWLGCTLRYRLYPFARSIHLSVWRRGSLFLILSHWGICLFQQPPSTPTSHPPAFAQALKYGSQEMKRLRQVKLSSSPCRTFLVVIHSWQKPIHALTACVPTDV